jgi:carboxyl-terminal processing protease
MKKLIVFTLFVLAINIFAQNPEAVLNKNHKIDSSAVVIPDEFQKRTSQVITQMLTSYHYKKQVLNDSLSSKIFDEYIQNLDNNKLYFLKSDIDEFEIYRLQFDDFLKEGNLEIPFKIFNIYKGRLEERIKNVRKLLSSEFDFSVDESFVPDRKESPWAVSSEELDELWRLRVKNDILNLVLSGKDQKSSAEVILKRYQNFHKIILQYEAEDVFSLVVNSFTQVIDPHTDYFSPAASENFNIAMKLSLEGIGATLRSENDYTIVAGIVAGGPAFKSGLLKEEDRIIAVGQGEDGELVDIIGWRLDDAIQLIRGKKGTTVRLSILKAKDGINAAPQEIKIVREEVKLEDQAAKDEIINIRNDGVDYRYGVIKLPSFYTDWEGQRLGKPDYRSTTRDVKRILEKFKSENIDGVILDLRNNGGGSLQEAISLTGLFIKTGPVVQVRNSTNIVEVENDYDANVAYDGPMAVIINRFSASASEIFAGAIQDYGAGIVLGENSYGKGTVQNMIDLNKIVPVSNKKMGQIKMTVAKFYRITGNSTQRLGVQPDIEFPSPYDTDEMGERAKPSALAFDKINTTQFSKVREYEDIIKMLLKKHDYRMKTDSEYQIHLDEIAEFNSNQSKKTVSLNENQRKEERKLAADRRKKREEERAKLTGIKIEDKKEVEAVKKSEPDFDLKESGRILTDLILSKVG